MQILGIETATPTCSVAVWRNGGLAGEIRYRQNRVHAEIISGLVQDIVKQCDAPLNSLDGVAVSIGPGSFTGLRIGLAMAKGLAFGGNVPIVGVNTTDAIAASVYPKIERMIVTIASRKGEVYAAKFRGLDNAYVREGKVEAVLCEQFSDWADGVSFITGTGASALQKAGLGDLEFVPEHYWQIGAAAVARLGARRIIAGDFDDVNILEPEYVKPFFTTEQ